MKHEILEEDVKALGSKGGISVGGSGMPRRSMLGGMLLGAAGLAVGGLAPAGAAARGVRGRRLELQGDPTGKRAYMAERFAQAGIVPGVTAEQAKASTPDGYLPNSIAGFFAAGNASSLILLAGPAHQPVTVAVTSTTPVTAGGAVRMGDVSGCRVGDSIFAATSFNSLGRRVAGFVEANTITYWATVMSVKGNVLACRNSAYGEAAGSTVEIELVPMTRIVGGFPQAGDSIYCAACMSAPVSPANVWATFIANDGPATWN